MAFLHFDSKFTPGGFLIVADGADPYSEDPMTTALIQLGDQPDFAHVARSLGWQPHSGQNNGEPVQEPYDYLHERDGESFPALNEYLKG